MYWPPTYHTCYACYATFALLTTLPTFASLLATLANDTCQRRLLHLLLLLRFPRLLHLLRLLRLLRSTCCACYSTFAILVALACYICLLHFLPLPCYNQLQKYLRHCTVFWHKWPVHDLLLVISLHPLLKLLAIQDHAQNLEEQLLMGGTREVSIISHRPVTSSDLKQERSFFRGSVSTVLQLFVWVLHTPIAVLHDY